MHQPIRVALLGCGGISGDHAKGYLKYADKIGVTALVDVSADNRTKRAEQLGGNPRQFDDWKKLFAEAADTFDAVDICLPHHLHAPAILDAVAAGKHVICEKPMCTTLAEADRIVAAVNAAGITYMSAHNQLFMPAVQEAKKRIDAGAIGRVLWLRSQDCFRLNYNDLGRTWRGSLKTQGGGELIDTGYHPTYRLLHLAGSPVAAVRGTFARFVQQIEGEDSASVQVRFASGAIGEIYTTWAHAMPHGTHQIHVVGTEGQLFGSADTLYHLRSGSKEPERIDFPPTHTIPEGIGHFADCLREGRRPIHAAEEGRDVLRVILQAAESAAGWDASGPSPVLGGG